MRPRGGPPVVPPPEHGAHYDRRRRRSRQIDAEPHRQRRQRVALRRAQRLVNGDDQRADQRADADETPVDLSSDHALRQRGDQRRLRRGQRLHAGVHAGRTDEAVRAIEQVEDRRDHERAHRNPRNQRDLLPPRRRVDELARLEILQIVVRDRRDAEQHGGDEQRVRDHLRHAGRAGAARDREHDERRAEHRKNRKPRDRAVRRSDQARHVAARRGNEEPRHDDVEHRCERQRAGERSQRAVREKRP